MKNEFLYILLVFLLVACKEETTLPGYTLKPSGIEFKMLTLGDESLPVKDADNLVLSLKAFDLNGKELANNHPYEYNSPYVFESANQSILNQEISNMLIGDSIAYILPYKELNGLIQLFVPDSDKVVLHIKLLDRKDPEWFELQKRHPGMASTFPDDLVELASFFDTIQSHYTLEIGDMFFVQTVEGEGPHPATGDLVRVEYEGFFVNGKKFDSTIDRNEPFDYNVGQSGQVLLGFNIGVRQLKKNGEAYFILPSNMAFSKRGSTDGTVPPNTTVIYKVKLLSIGSYAV